jgi:hypothetical protein
MGRGQQEFSPAHPKEQKNRSALTENRDGDFLRFLHVIPAGEPVTELTVKVGIFVFLNQLCLQNTLQGV